MYFNKQYNYGEFISNNAVFIDAYWFANGGIVLIYDKYDGYKAYIKSVKSNATIREDIDEIAKMGDPFPIESTAPLFQNVDFSKKVL